MCPPPLPYRLVTSKRFTKAAHKFLKQHPDVREQFEVVLTLLRHDPYAPSLETHGLKGKMRGMSGVRLTHSYRLLVIIRVTEHEIELLDVGDHDEVYS